MSFKSELRTIGFRQEVTPYTQEGSFTSSDYDLRVANLEYDPQIMETARKLARGDLSVDSSVIGKKSIKIKFRAEVYTANAEGTPAYGKCLKSCGYYQYDVFDGHNLVGSTFTPDSTMTNAPAAIEIVEKAEGTSPKQIVVTAYGCMGNATWLFDGVGKPIAIDFEFDGAFAGFSEREYGDIIPPIIIDTEPCPPLISSAITYDNKEQVLDNLKMSLGCKVELYSSPSPSCGFLGAHIVSRDPSIEFDPDLQTITDEDYWTNFITQDNKLAFKAIIGAVNSRALRFDAPTAQIVQALKPKDREGHVTHQVKLRLVRGAAGDDEFSFREGTSAWIDTDL